jgi:hypothetical protein
MTETQNTTQPIDAPSDFVAPLTVLRTPKKHLTAVPIFTPKTFADQIQFVLIGGKYYVYVYVNGAWRISGSSYTHGGFTKNMADASTTQNIAHGLGVAPTLIKMTAHYTDGTLLLTSFGTYDGSTMQNIFTYPGPNTASTTTTIIKLIPALGGNIQDATATVDATNIILSWTKTGSPTGNAYFLWEAYA